MSVAESPPTGRWESDEFVLDIGRYELRRGTDVVAVEPQVFDVLTWLVTNHDRCVTKEELFDSVWGGRFVGEAALTSRIKAVRRALGDDGESPVWRHWVDDLSRRYRFVRYDERGCGLSDWAVQDFTFDDWVDDLGSLVDALELPTFSLLGVSQGGAVAVAYAARHPERVSKLVLCGAYARGRAVQAIGDDEKRAAALDLDLARVGWGRDDPAFRQVFAAQFLPEGSRDDWRAFDELQRRTTSTDNAVRFLQEFAHIDVRDLAGLVTCPTLVMHSRDDHRVPMRFGEELAALIPHARFLALPSQNHLLTGSEPAWRIFCAETDAFLAEGAAPTG